MRVHFEVPAIVAFVLTSGVVPAAAAGPASQSGLGDASQQRNSNFEGECYQAQATGDGYRLQNPLLHGTAEFTLDGVQFNAGTSRWAMSMEGYGRGEEFGAAEAAYPQVTGKRIEYRRGALTEWYVNDRAGLEQGFTLSKPPDGPVHGPLTVALRLSGAGATLDASGKGMSLSIPGGGETIRYHGLASYDASGRSLRTWLELRGDRVLLRVDDSNARYPVVIDPYYQVAKLTSSEGASDELFGLSISQGAGVVVIGAPGHAFSDTGPRGAAYTYVKGSSGWQSGTQTGRLVASPAADGDGFGASVSASADGTTIVVGAPGVSSDTGAAYVFVKPSVGWDYMTPTAKLTASNGGSGDRFGNVSVNSDGSIVAVGADGYDGDAGSSQGTVYLFTRPSGGWSGEVHQSTRLTASDAQKFDGFGLSVAISPDGLTLAVAAPYKNLFGDAPQQGALYVFTRDGSSWTERAQLSALNGAADDTLGASLGISQDGSTIVAGAPGTAVGTATFVGGVYVFERPSGGWVTATDTGFLGASIPSAGDSMGRSVGINANGTRVVAGVPGAYGRQGAAFLYNKPLSGWSSNPDESLQLVPTDSALGDIFGLAVSMSQDGATIAASAPDKTVGSTVKQGAGYVFENILKTLSDFSISSISLTQGATGTNIDLKTNFLLDALSDGISPTTETVRIQVGSLFLTIPPGSFRKNSRGDYNFQGIVDGLSIGLLFKRKPGNAWWMSFETTDAPLQPYIGTIPVMLSVGNDAGSTN